MAQAFILTGYQHRRILGTRVEVTNYHEVIARVTGWAHHGESCYVCLGTVNNVMEAWDSPAYHHALEDAAIVTADGMPLVWMLKALGAGHASRVYGPDLTPMLLEAAAQQGIPVGFYGGTNAVLSSLVDQVERRFPTLRVAYREAPPFRPLTPEETERTIAAIRASGARILFVGLGSPKQDVWMHQVSSRIPAVLLGVGAAFDFLAGAKSQAPRWMMCAGMEWIFRLASEPRRLWRRYLRHNPRFVVLALKQLYESRPAPSR